MTEQKTYRIVRLVQTCSALPSQWEGRTDAGDDAYIRYRGGWFSVRIGHDILSAGNWEAFDAALVYEARIGGQFDGEMSHEEMIATLPEFITIDVSA